MGFDYGFKREPWLIPKCCAGIFGKTEIALLVSRLFVAFKNLQFSVCGYPFRNNDSNHFTVIFTEDTHTFTPKVVVKRLCFLALFPHRRITPAAARFFPHTNLVRSRARISWGWLDTSIRIEVIRLLFRVKTSYHLLIKRLPRQSAWRRASATSLSL